MLPEGRLLSNTWEWIVRGDTRTDKAKDFIGKGHSGREQGGKGTQENCSAMWLLISGFMLVGLAFWCLWPIILFVPIFGLSQGPSWWRVQLSAKMDSSVRVSGRWAGHSTGWHRLLPCGPSRILPVSFQWQHHIPYWNLLLWDPSYKQLLLCPARAGGFGQWFPNTSILRGNIGNASPLISLQKGASMGLSATD